MGGRDRSTLRHARHVTQFTDWSKWGGQSSRFPKNVLSLYHHEILRQISPTQKQGFSLKNADEYGFLYDVVGKPASCYAQNEEDCKRCT